MTDKPFRILALSGGGARGIFQAAYLIKVADMLGGPLRDRFDLIAGTSTGALTGIALALGIAPQRIVDFYQRDAERVFKLRLLARANSGTRYSQKPLRAALDQFFKGRRLADCVPPVMVPAVTVDRFHYKLFSTFDGGHEGDGNLQATDVALASAAAPTFFPAVRPLGEERTFVDGGLFANSPALLAVLEAHRQRKIPFRQIRVLAIGTGTFPQGMTPDDFSRLRQISRRTVRMILELMSAAQESFADDFARGLLSAGNFLGVNTVLNSELAMDDAPNAIVRLQPLAAKVFEDTKDLVSEFFAEEPGSEITKTEGQRLRKPQFVPKELIEAAGLTAFYPSRAYYSYRNGAASIDRYISTARHSLTMVSINLSTGLPMDGMLDVMREKLEGPSSNFIATISLLNPASNYLMEAIGPPLDLTATELAESIRKVVQRLVTFKKGLSGHAQARLHLRLHNAVPLGSAIMLDHAAVDGRIQIETKSYRTPGRKSFGFEVMRTGQEGDLYRTLVKAYELLIEHGSGMDTI